MKSDVVNVEPVPPDNDLKCSMHDGRSPTCSGRVVAVVTLADAGSRNNRYRVCQWWYDNKLEAQRP
ncbi:hypothetical protein [Streptomyces parvus]|uniref:Uncharacterized protein n=1 Tax=Streptomyces parvus TaxID=66428 RepID=A0A5D4JHZ1_9ACTN|nr:hypothetical protein [Streptomyces parvus]TYR63293.1 hypothetical protein FY004_17600 [Streptomyces parvus]